MTKQPNGRPDTLAALVTPPGEGGISIVALAGPGAARILDDAFRGTHRPAGRLAPGDIAHGRIVRKDTTLDEVIVARVDVDGAPTYEVNCHGGAQAVQAVLRRLEEAGATIVPAPMPGGDVPETDRPLAQRAIRAAALRLLPRARTRLGVRMLLSQADGALRGELDAMASRDAPRTRERLSRLLATAPPALALLTPPRVLLMGPPNVGKSTLMNALLRRDRVIVHHYPGTTRDVVRELVSMHGIPMELMDTAGIRTAADEVERQAVRKATDLVAHCDVALVLFDAREGPDWAAQRIQAIRGVPRVILVGNKVDLLAAVPADSPVPGDLAQATQVFVAARDGRGIEDVEAALLAPYRKAAEALKRGAGAAFTDAIVTALKHVAARLNEAGRDSALEELARLS